MVQLADYYALKETIELVPTTEQDNNVNKNKSLNDKPSAFGLSMIRYEVQRYQDVANLASRNAYVLSMTQRIIVPNQTPYTPGAQDITGYMDYPVLLQNIVQIPAPEGMALKVTSLFPRTLNATVSMTQTSGDGSNQSVSHESTRGSSTTNVNTYGVSASIGFFGDLPTGSLGADYSHSTEKTQSRSSSQGNNLATSHNVGEDDSMSVKDWSAYSQLDSRGVNPQWVWGQGYPWDVILYNQQSNNGTINIPSFVENRMLVDDNFVLPPSELSLFGLDFTMKASWIIELADDAPFDDSINISHQTNCFTASHQYTAANVLKVTLQTEEEASKANYQVNLSSLSAYALSPIGMVSKGGAIGFTAHPFLVPPAQNSDPFKIVSAANNLQVTGSGFTTGLTTDFAVAPKIEIIFKVADTTTDYMLHLMHWIGTGSGGCELAWCVNGKYNGMILVSAEEGKGGDSNISAVELRNSDYSSISFHDYLVLGTNTITLAIKPVDIAASNSYTLFAVAVTG